MSELKDLQDKLSLIDVIAIKDKNKLMHTYAIDNAKHSIGDVLTGNCDTIIVERLRWTSGMLGNEPQVVYYGPILTKKLQPRKDGAKNSVYGSDVKCKLDNKEV